jgi:hypothetical protein
LSAHQAFKKTSTRQQDPIRVIFLDLDGVLITHRAARALVDDGGFFEDIFDPIAVALFNRLASPPDVRVVLTSARRYDRGIRQLLKRNNVQAKWHASWRTAPTRGGKKSKRGWLVREWLDRRGNNVQSYVILDDSRDFLPSQKPRHVVAPLYDGLTYQNYLDARKILAQPLIKS